jgi:hypothetical protein
MTSTGRLVAAPSTTRAPVAASGMLASVRWVPRRGPRRAGGSMLPRSCRPARPGSTRTWRRARGRRAANGACLFASSFARAVSEPRSSRPHVWPLRGRRSLGRCLHQSAQHPAPSAQHPAQHPSASDRPAPPRAGDVTWRPLLGLLSLLPPCDRRRPAASHGRRPRAARKGRCV